MTRFQPIPTFRVGELESMPSELGFAGPVFLLNVSVDVVQGAVDPSSEHDEAPMQHHGFSPGFQAWQHRVA